MNRFLLPALLLLCACGDDGKTKASGTTGAGGTGGDSTSSTGAGGNVGGGGAGGAGGQPALADVHLIGRFDDMNRSSWSGSSYRTRVSGGPVSVSLDAPSGIHFEVEVDGVSQGTFVTQQGDNDYVVPNTPPAGAYELLVHRRVEGFFGDVRFVGITPGAGEEIVPTPWPYDHRVEFIGDSITCGYGALGPDEFCDFSADTESSYVSYAAVASRAVNASAHLIAFSGKGVFQNYGGDQSELMPELYLRTLTSDPAPWDFATDTDPDAVLINLGTNDFSVALAEADFVGAYVGLLTTVRQHRPEAAIFAVRWEHWGPTHMGWVSAALSQFADPDVHEVTFAIDPADGWGCDYHPSAVTHEKLGAQLATTFQSVLGW
jgi:lysophospholipase L1-like esterase